MFRSPLFIFLFFLVFCWDQTEAKAPLEVLQRTFPFRENQFTKGRRKSCDQRIALVTGYFSPKYVGSTWGDFLSTETIVNWLNEAGLPAEVYFRDEFLNGPTGKLFVNETELLSPEDPSCSKNYEWLVFACGPFRWERIKWEWGMVKALNITNLLVVGTSIVESPSELKKHIPPTWNTLFFSRDHELEDHGYVGDRVDLAFYPPRTHVPVIGLSLSYSLQDLFNPTIKSSFTHKFSKLDAVLVRFDTQESVIYSKNGKRENQRLALMEHMDLIIGDQDENIVMKSGVPYIPAWEVMELDASSVEKHILNLLSNSSTKVVARSPEKIPVVGVVMILEDQPEHNRDSYAKMIMELINELLSRRKIITIKIDTTSSNSSLLPSTCSSEAILSILSKVDAVITNRLHGCVLSLRSGTPIVPIDGLKGGAKVSRQAGLLGWPRILFGENLTIEDLEVNLDWALSKEARELAWKIKEEKSNDKAEEKEFKELIQKEILKK